MRARGRVDHGRGLGTSDHLCWAYDQRAGFVAAGIDFLTDGQRLGQRLMYVGGRSTTELRADLDSLPGVDRLIDEGRLGLLSIPTVYDLSAPIVPDQQLATYADATEGALADGFTGLRVLADVTDLVVDPARRVDHLRWEHLADDYMNSNPLSACCGYDVNAVPKDTVSELASVHPVLRGSRSLAPFQLFFDGDHMVLAGEVDGFTAAALHTLLASTHRSEGDVVIDVSELVFVDGRALSVLAAYGRRIVERGGTLRLIGATPLLDRMWRLLEFDHLPGITLDVPHGRAPLHLSDPLEAT